MKRYCGIWPRKIQFWLVEQEFWEADNRKIALYPPPMTPMCLFLLSQIDADSHRSLCAGEATVFHGGHGVDNWCRTMTSWAGLVPGSQNSHSEAKEKLNRSFLLYVEVIRSTLGHQEVFSSCLVKELLTCLLLFYQSSQSRSQWPTWSGNSDIISHCSHTLLLLLQSLASFWFLNISHTPPSGSL